MDLFCLICLAYFCGIRSVEPEKLCYDEIAAIIIYGSPKANNSLSYKSSEFFAQIKISTNKKARCIDTLEYTFPSATRITHLRHKLAGNTLKPFNHDGGWSFALLVANMYPAAERLELSLVKSRTYFTACAPRLA